MSESYPALRAVLAEIQDRKGETLSEGFLARVVAAVPGGTARVSDWIDERRLEGEMGAVNRPSEAAVREVARKLDDEVTRRNEWYGLDNWTFHEVATFALNAAHDPANFEDPRGVSVNLGAVLDRVRHYGSVVDADAVSGTRRTLDRAAMLLLFEFGGDRG